MEHQRHPSNNSTRIHRARKRRHSDTSTKLSDIKHVHTLQKTVLSVLLGRLAEGGVNTESITPELLNHCLPNSLDNNSWETLLYTPLKLSDRKLQDMLRLKNTELGDQTLQQTTVYIRCFQIKVDQLQEVIAQFHGTGMQYAKTTIWLGSIKGMQSDETVYIRYVGRTTRTQGAIKRHREDLLTRRTGFFSKFLTGLERTFPTVIDSASVYVFPNKQIKGLREIQDFNDVAEQAAIALLGLPYLLNQVLTKTEGWTLKLHESHWQQFDALGTRTISRLNPCEFYPLAQEPSIASWADAIQCYARDHQGSVSFFRRRSHDFPNSLRDTVFRQAMPSAWRGRFVLLLTVGAGNSREGYKEQRPFYTGPSQSADLLRTSLNRLWNREESKRPEREYLCDLIAAGALPFVDLCPWYQAEGDDLLAAARLLKHPTQLFIRKRPRIAVAIRKELDRDVLSGFAVGEKLSDKRRQQVYRLWGMNIPELHVHIGRDNVNEWFLWGNSVSQGKSLFVDAITQAVWTSSQQCSSQSSAVKQQITSIRKTTAISLGHFADNSDKVAEIELPGALLKEFREVLATNKLESNNWASYSSIEQAVTMQLMKDSIFWEWIHSTRISNELSNDGFIRFKSTYRGHWNEREVFVWKNSPFGIYWESPSGQNFKFIMRAPQSSQDSSHTPRKYIFFTKDGIDLRDETGKSCLVHQGALNSDGVVTFPTRHLPNCQETADLGKQLVTLWETETGLDWRDTTAVSHSLQNQVKDEDGSELPKGFFTGQGLELIRLNWSSEKLQPYRKPPQPADETWLLWLCLKENWPLGGIVFIGIPEKWPSRKDNIWTHLQEF
ncbi:hypothetical protein AARAC_005622 [Aspergillus arachidicola]|uniref:Uncharacterized protein n=1 Tax=Aspergillus arachidicola TaxID=656916 RepID=A0A2G7FYJ4_9EURO|nr:hypothetical protein AARAC_005622 [Aspergillus arachidicola]